MRKLGENNPGLTHFLCIAFWDVLGKQWKKYSNKMCIRDRHYIWYLMIYIWQSFGGSFKKAIIQKFSRQRLENLWVYYHGRIMQCYCKLKIKKLLLSYAQNAEGNVLSSTEGKRIDKDRGFRMSTESKTRMTEGSIARRIILFAIPLFLGNLFQQLYNCLLYTSSTQLQINNIFVNSSKVHVSCTIDCITKWCITKIIFTIICQIFFPF